MTNPQHNRRSLGCCLLLGAILASAAPAFAQAESRRVSLPAVIALDAMLAENDLAITVTLASPHELGQLEQVRVRILGSDSVPCTKFLHNGDPDLFLTLRRGAAVGCKLEIGDLSSLTGQPIQADVDLQPLQSKGDGDATIELEPNNVHAQAMPIRLGQTVFASCDDRPYIPAPHDEAADESDAGVDWYAFEQASDVPVLAYVWLDVTDREVPVDVAIFKASDAGPVPYGEKFERFEPERTTQYAGQFKFVARQLEKGSYLLRVRANHPEYRLRSEVYPLPPYVPADQGSVRESAQLAIRAAADYLVLKGDSWHANTPRVGGVADRRHNLHSETAQCIACHPTQFTLRAHMIAVANGYPVRRREQVEFLTERLYNSPRPFYGHPQADWARMISASANTLSRPATLLDQFERFVSHRPRERFHRGVAEYLKLYYKDRAELPPDESNGSRTPVSAFEVALHSWQVLDRAQRLNGDAEAGQTRDLVRRLLETDSPTHVQDLLDLCWQTVAFCQIDRAAYADRVQANVERLLAEQRADGQFPMEFGPEKPAAEFQTGHALYALALAGLSPDEPRVDRAIRYLLSRQHAFGAWFDDDDPREPHPYEAFQTPFRETQYALMALAQFFPGAGAEGWQAGYQPVAAMPATDDDVAGTLMALDQLWERPSDEVVSQIVGALQSRHVQVRSAAAACLGRSGGADAVEPLIGLLKDGSKLVRRQAAWALRQLGNQGVGKDQLRVALEAADPWLRRGALQVLAQHFRFWTDRPDLAHVLADRLLVDADPYVRWMASRALWQWWYWDADEGVRSHLEDAFLTRLGAEKDPLVQSNLSEGFYIICDENVRYLYNNWFALLGNAADRDQAIAGHLATSARQASKIAQALRSADPRQALAILDAIGFFHQRSDKFGGMQGHFTRVGNDKETIQFYAAGAADLKQALVPWLQSEDAAIRAAALLAGYTLRDTQSEDLLAIHYLRGLADPDPLVRERATQFQETFAPRIDDANAGDFVDVLRSLLASTEPGARRAALKLISRSEFSPERTRSLEQALQGYLDELPIPAPGETDVPIRAELLSALGALPGLWQLPRAREELRHALRSSRDEDRRAGASLALGDESLSRAVHEELDALFGSTDAAVVKSLLALLASDTALAHHVRGISLVADTLTDADPALAQQALELVRGMPDLLAQASVRSQLANLAKSADERLRASAQSLLTGDAASSAGLVLDDVLSYEYFVAKVQPIFLAKGKDGNSCVDCHLNHGVLKLTGSAEQLPSEPQSRENYRSALKVIDLPRPERSLLLIKPTSTADFEGVANADEIPHGGELRWDAGQQSREYQIILEWIQGATVQAPAE